MMKYIWDRNKIPSWTQHKPYPIGLVLAVLMAFPVVHIGPFEDRADASFTETVSQWNIWGTCNGGKCGGFGAAQTVVFLIANANSSQRPTTITFNEMCAKDLRPNQITPYEYLAFALAPFGYTANFKATTYAADCGSGANVRTRQFGNAIFQLGAVSATPVVDYYYAVQQANNNRHLLCHRTNIFGLLRNGCVTHLDTQDSFATDQSALMDFLLTLLSPMPTVASGDFNVDPLPYFGGFRRTNTTLRTFRADALQQTIDFSIGNRAAHSGSAHTGRICDIALSDHCLISGRHLG